MAGSLLAEPARRAKPRLRAAERAVAAALRRRGLRWQGERDPTPILQPVRAAACARHLALLGHYSYRLVLRDVLKQRTALDAAALARWVVPAVAGRYLAFLARAGLVVRSGRGRFRLADARIVSFGGTLEWYVATLLAREFGCDAAWGLRIPGAAHGGDYDVVACAEGALLYLETKSAPPRQVMQSEVAAFLDRIDTLRPDAALFVMDTTLRMRDKLVPMFAEEARRRRLPWTPSRLQREIWVVGPEIYLLNAAPDLTSTLGTCLATHFRRRGICAPRDPVSGRERRASMPRGAAGERRAAAGEAGAADVPE